MKNIGINDLDYGLNSFDDTQKCESDYRIEEWVFPILGYKGNDPNHSEYGTGFFVNNNGYFITAGHVLKNNDLCYKAQIAGQLLDIEVVYFEHISKNDQRPPICKDFAICRMNYRPNIIFKLIQQQVITGKVNISGCTITPLSKLTINPVKNGNFYINMICAGAEKVNSPRDLPENSLDYRPICENTMSLKLQEGIHYNGLSGGPVYFENTILGMFIGFEYIQSNYIVEKLDQFKIPFNI